MSLFKDCFGDLSIETQEHLAQILNRMTDIINKELETKPLKIGFGGSEIIKLEKIPRIKKFKFNRIERG